MAFAAAPSSRTWPCTQVQPRFGGRKHHAPASTQESVTGRISTSAESGSQVKADVTVADNNAGSDAADLGATGRRIPGYQRATNLAQADLLSHQPQLRSATSRFRSNKKLGRSASGQQQDHLEGWSRTGQHAPIRRQVNRLDAPGQFSDCSTYQQLLERLQQLQQQLKGQSPEDGKQQHEQQQQHWQPLLTATDFVDLINQLSAIREGASSRSSNDGGGNSSNFVEEQALLQILPLAYHTLDYYAYGSSGQPTPSTAPVTARRSSTSSKSVQLLYSISILASLQYSQPSRLAALLTLPAAGRQGMSRLRIHQLSALVAALAKSDVKPSNSWLAALMQAAEAKLQAAKLTQLSELLHGLVKMGVKPAASWLDNLQDQAISCLIEQAVRYQIVSDHTQQEQQHIRTTDMATAAAASGGQHSSKPPVNSRRAMPRIDRRLVDCQLHGIAQLLTAFAEAKHSLKPQLSAALWGATASSLAVADAWALVQLLSALGELGLVPPGSWMQQYYSRTATLLQQQGQYRPWQLSESIEALGRLVQAGMDCCNSSNMQQQGSQADLQETSTTGSDTGVSVALNCCAWVSVVLLRAQQQLTSLSARDLAVLLSGLAALHLPLAPQQLDPFFAEVQQKLPRLNTAGLAMLAEAAAQLNRQQLVSSSQQLQAVAQQSSVQELPVQLTERWNKALLHETLVKLPMFPADDLARLVIALSGTSTCRPSHAWLEAAAAHLHSKLTTLAPYRMVHLVAALVAMGYVPEKQWFHTLLTTVESRAIEMNSRDMLQLLELVLALQLDLSKECIAALQWAVQQQVVQDDHEYECDGHTACVSNEESQAALQKCIDLL